MDKKGYLLMSIIGIIGISTLVAMPVITTIYFKPSNCTEDSIEEIETPTKIEIGDFEVTHITVDGHKYLFFDNPSRTGLGGVVHDQNCPCTRSSVSE